MRDGVDRMTSYRTIDMNYNYVIRALYRTEPTEKLLQELGKAQRYRMHPIMQYTTITTVDGHFKSRMFINPEHPTPSLQNCHAHSLKTAKQ